MAFTLRSKKLSKKPPTSDMLSVGDGESRPGSSSSSDDFEAVMTRKGKVKVRERNASEAPETVPPPLSKSPLGQSHRQVTPPATLLDRYHSGDAKSANSPSQATATPPQRDENEYLDDDLARSFSKGLRRLSASLTSPSTPDTHIVKGVQFDMLHKCKAKQTHQGPTNADNETTVTQGGRVTRSQSKKQRRNDSVEDAPEVKDIVYGNGYLSPQAIRTNGMTLSASPTHSPRLTPSPNPAEPPSPDELAITPVSTDIREDKTRGTKLPARSPPDPLLSPLLLNLTQSNKSWDHRSSPNVTICPTPVIPPIFNSDSDTYNIWLSHNTAVSRPIDPWLPAKRWTCCMCPRLDPGREPAQMIVEQKVCSRLTCGHERCNRGCRFAIGAAFKGR